MCQSGVKVWSLLVTLHTDPESWGLDAHEFNPERSTNGITGACKLPHLYMPFGVGPRVCLGQNLAMVELKILISLILSNFSFSLSPNYKHSTAFGVVIEPEHGVNLLINKLWWNHMGLRLENKLNNGGDGHTYHV